jgi:hypothetical protein
MKVQALPKGDLRFRLWGMGERVEGERMGAGGVI